MSSTPHVMASIHVAMMSFLVLVVSSAQVAEKIDVFATLLEPVTTMARFEKHIYNKHALIVNRHQQQPQAFIEHLASLEPLTLAISSLKSFADYGYDQYASGVTPRGADGEALRLNSPINGSVHQLYQQGVSFVVKEELVGPKRSGLQQALRERFNTDITVHAYVSPQGAQALKVSIGFCCWVTDRPCIS